MALKLKNIKLLIIICISLIFRNRIILGDDLVNSEVSFFFMGRTGVACNTTSSRSRGTFR